MWDDNGNTRPSTTTTTTTPAATATTTATTTTIIITIKMAVVCGQCYGSGHVQSLVIPSGICGRQVGTVTHLFRFTRQHYSRYSYFFHQSLLLYSLSLAIGSYVN
jgi:hypothetical protein